MTMLLTIIGIVAALTVLGFIAGQVQPEDERVSKTAAVLPSLAVFTTLEQANIDAELKSLILKYAENLKKAEELRTQGDFAGAAKLMVFRPLSSSEREQLDEVRHLLEGELWNAVLAIDCAPRPAIWYEMEMRLDNAYCEVISSLPKNPPHLGSFCLAGIDEEHVCLAAEQARWGDNPEEIAQVFKETLASHIENLIHEMWRPWPPLCVDDETMMAEEREWAKRWNEVVTAILVKIIVERRPQLLWRK